MSQIEQAPLITTIGLSKSFKGRLVVNQAEFVVQPGDVFGLLGPNGAGKTTIIRMLLGLVKPTAGRAMLFGVDIATNRAEVLKKTSAIVEAPALYPHLNGWDNLRVMALSAGINDKQRMAWAMDQMGLTARANDRFKTYSLGMKQRLCIAAALLTDPQLIVLDEPTNGLDPAGMRDVRELIQTLSSQNRTVLVSSHLLNEVQQVCNRVAIIEAGRIVTQGLVSEMVSARSFIKIKVQPAEFNQAGAILNQLPWVAGLRQEGDYLVVEGPATYGAAINQALGQAGIFASEIIPRSQSLEEYFLSVTGQNHPLAASYPPMPVAPGPANIYQPPPLG